MNDHTASHAAASLATSRRSFLAQATAGCALAGAASLASRAALAAPPKSPWAGEVGVTTSSLDRHVSATGEPGKISLFDLPRFLRDELDIRVIDLNNNTLGSHDPRHVERFRDAVERAGCVVIHLKMNQHGIDIADPDPARREVALAEYHRSIDDAAILGTHWARPLPTDARPDMDLLVAGYRALCDYAVSRGLNMLVENYKWMQDDPESVVKLIRAIDRDVPAGPDTGNWNSNEIRYEGLAKTFPLAVTCDFKFRDITPEGEHPLYDLKKCFQIGWDAGFRGPWCMEHAQGDRALLVRELAMVRDMLRGWMNEAG